MRHCGLLHLHLLLLLLLDLLLLLRAILQVKGAMQHAWQNFRQHAWGRDELRPLSVQGVDRWGGYGVTLVDALDTLWLMGLKTEFQEGSSPPRPPLTPRPHALSSLSPQLVFTPCPHTLLSRCTSFGHSLWLSLCSVH